MGCYHVARVMEYMAEIEEGLGDEEYVLEDAISNVSVLKIDVPSRSVCVEVVQAVRSQQGKTVTKVITIH